MATVGVAVIGLQAIHILTQAVVVVLVVVVIITMLAVVELVVLVDQAVSQVHL